MKQIKKSRDVHGLLQQFKNTEADTASSESDVTKAVRIFCDLLKDKNENVRKYTAAAVNVPGSKSRKFLFDILHKDLKLNEGSIHSAAAAVSFGIGKGWI